MICNHTVREPRLALRLYTRCIDRRRDQGLEEIRVVVVMHTLQHGGNALQPHARIDRRLRQRHPVPRPPLLELHEHEVPDFNEPVAVRISRTRRPARDALLAIRIVVVENFRARSARTRVAHRPEVVGGRNADDPAVGKPRQLLPNPECIVVIMIDRHQQARLIELVLLGNQVPRQFDRALLEVVAEGEVTKHLEKRVMPRRIPDVIQIVVFATCAYALLRRCRRRVGPRLLPRENILELHHAGVGEHQRRIVARHERRGCHDLMTVALEVIEKRRSDLVDAAAAHRSQTFRMFSGPWGSQVPGQRDRTAPRRPERPTGP
jgi:hypothetical protein